jgi:sec-independent protein translocase protein TatB
VAFSGTDPGDMFDFGFTEMMIIAVVGLVVIGPERLPKVAKQAGQWLGKLRRYVDDVKSDINRQMELQELKNLQTEMTEAARDVQTSLQSTMSQVQSDFDQVQQSISGSASESPAAQPATDWDRIYAVRRQRDRIRERRIEREKELGIRRPRRPLHR